MVVRLHLIIKKDAIANANKGVSWINYDQWGNPIRVQFTDHSITEHVYTADGRRLKTIHRTSVPQSPSLGIGVTASLPSSLTQSIDSVDYVGNFIYEKGQLKRYMFDDGYLRLNTNNTCVPRFFIKDHLGNNRILTDGSGNIKQNTNYYPYGGMTSISTSQGEQQFKYNGKEYDPMHGLNEYDYGARQYDPAISKFTTMDPLCEKYYHISPYAYCAGNPVNLMDLDGRHIYTINENGEIKKISNDSHMDLHISYDGLDMAKFSFGFLEQFTSERDDYKGHYGNTSNLDDAVSLFMFAAKNTDVEWAISSYYQNNEKLDYLVYTSHSEDGVTFTNGNHKFKNIHAHIHSHPRGTGNDKASCYYSQMNNGQKEYRSFGSDDLSFINGKYIEYMKIYPNKDFHRDYPKFYIYNARTNKLFRYDHRNPYIPVK
jgi:RHS repeat-associated protein